MNIVASTGNNRQLSSIVISLETFVHLQEALQILKDTAGWEHTGLPTSGFMSVLSYMDGYDHTASLVTLWTAWSVLSDVLRRLYTFNVAALCRQAENKYFLCMRRISDAHAICMHSVQIWGPSIHSHLTQNAWKKRTLQASRSGKSFISANWIITELMQLQCFALIQHFHMNWYNGAKLATFITSAD